MLVAALRMAFFGRAVSAEADMAKIVVNETSRIVRRRKSPFLRALILWFKSLFLFCLSACCSFKDYDVLLINKPARIAPIRNRNFLVNVVSARGYVLKLSEKSTLRFCASKLAES